MSGGYDSLEALSEVYNGSYLTPEQIAAEEKRSKEQQAAVLRCVQRKAAEAHWGEDRRDEILQMLGLMPTPIAEVFPDCGHPQTAENTVMGSRGTGRYCRRCKNRAEPTQRAVLRHPRKKAGQL